jgi:hypothetical protein
MRKYLWLVVAVVFSAGLGRPLCGQHLVPGYLNDFVVVLPQVAKGDLIETTIVFLNTSTTAVDVAVEATDEQLLEPTSFELGPFERRDLKLDAEGELVKGAVRVQAESTISVEGRIRTRPEPGAEFTSQVTVLAEPLHSEVVVPISYQAEGVDNTGIALYFEAPGMLKFHAYDAEGDEVAEWQEPGGGSEPRYRARFFDEYPEIARNLGDRFTGSLRIKFTNKGLAAAALYTRGLVYWTARVQAVREAQNEYYVELEAGVDPSVLSGMSGQYGFELGGYAGELWGITCTDDVATAVERDPRVKRVIRIGAPPVS